MQVTKKEAKYLLGVINIVYEVSLASKKNDKLLKKIPISTDDVDEIIGKLEEIARPKESGQEESVKTEAAKVCRMYVEGPEENSIDLARKRTKKVLKNWGKLGVVKEIASKEGKLASVVLTQFSARMQPLGDVEELEDKFGGFDDEPYNMVMCYIFYNDDPWDEGKLYFVEPKRESGNYYKFYSDGDAWEDIMQLLGVKDEKPYSKEQLISKTKSYK